MVAAFVPQNRAEYFNTLHNNLAAPLARRRTFASEKSERYTVCIVYTVKCPKSGRNNCSLVGGWTAIEVYFTDKFTGAFSRPKRLADFYAKITQILKQKR